MITKFKYDIITEQNDNNDFVWFIVTKFYLFGILIYKNRIDTAYDSYRAVLNEQEFLDVMEDINCTPRDVGIIFCTILFLIIKIM